MTSSRLGIGEPFARINFDDQQLNIILTSDLDESHNFLYFITTVMSDSLATGESRKDRQMTEPASVDSNIDHASSIEYWNSTPATANAMLGDLGNFPWYSRIDLRGSANFLGKVRRLLPTIPTTTAGKQFGLGVDCGAGVGRVTEGFLRNVCDVVDAVEPVENFASVLRQGPLKKDGVVGDIYVTGLENWNPTKKYDLIWCQWCVGHITDAQFTEYLVRCRAALTETGIMVVKENMSSDPNGEDMYDDLDSSVTRSDRKYRDIFQKAGMALILSEIQSGFPKKYKLLPVRSYALRPRA
jgi:protein N-terminal methyltransferase